MAAGCGSGSGSGVKAGAIQVAGVSGNASSLTVATTAKLSMMPSGDSSGAGVDWTVACGGNPVTGSVTGGACGTLSPLHTADGAATVYTAPAVVPIGTTVTVTASVTSNPSQSSGVSFTIVPLPIVVAFNAANPTSLPVDAQATPSVTVTNDPANAGVAWTVSCMATACGSFSPITAPSAVNTTYTAPSVVPTGGTVTITATSLTDTTKSVSATITITPTPPPTPPLPIVVTVSPSSLYVQTTGAARLVRLTPVVTNDPAAGGVDWTLSCQAASCGQITAHSASGVAVSYVGPSSVPLGGSVTIAAISTSDPSVSATATAAIITTTPIIVTIPSASSLPPTLTEGAQATLGATVANDPANLGVNWSASCGSAGACGSFNLSPAHTAIGATIVYTAPAAVPSGGLVTVTASSPSTAPSNPAFTSTVIVAQPPSVSFVQTPPSSLVSTATAPVSASVANDIAPGGVTWSVQCGSSVAGGCGYILPTQTASGATATYTAPPVINTGSSAPGTSVTIVASSTSDPLVSVSSAPIAINPSATLTVEFVPLPPSQIQAGATVNLEAAVSNDPTNGGVDWQVCASGCGFFTTQQAVPAVPATATTPYVPAVPAVTATTVTGWPNNLPLPYTAPNQAPSSQASSSGSGPVVIQVSAHAEPSAANSATVAIASAETGPALHGTVQAGRQPVVGASVALYAAGTSGYGSAASLLYASGGPSTATTTSSGSFTLPSGYECPAPNSQVYLLATGGQVGTNGANPNLVLMTALGSCSSLTSASVVLNEATSVASAYATAPFAANDALTGNSSYLYLGASSTNATGLANAFAAVNNLVDVSTGLPRFTVPAGNAAVPYVEINTLADVLNACANSSGGAYGDFSACGAVFTYAAVLGPPNSLPTSYDSIAPTDTLQAVFNIAQHPATGYGYQLSSQNSPLGLVTGSSPFQPAFTQLPNDWSISLNYTGGGGISAASVGGSLAIDAAGDVWFTDTHAGTAIELNAVGAALSPTSGYAAGGGPLAIDAAGDIWISGDGSLSELTSLGSQAPGSPFGGVAGGGSDMAMDAQSNLWIATGAGVAEFNNQGAEISPSAGYTNNGVTGVAAVGIDSSNDVWAGDNPAQIAELTNPGGQLIAAFADAVGSGSAGAGSSVGEVIPEIAADGKGDMWSLTTAGIVCNAPPYAGNGTTPQQSCYGGGGSGDFYEFANAEGIALDGTGVVWVASSGGAGLSGANGQPTTIPPNVLPINPSLGSSVSEYLVSQSLSAGTVRLEVDGSGNVWVLLANGTVTEYVGLATPTVTPIALALKNKKLAATP